MTTTYRNIETTEANRVTVRSSDGRSTFAALILERSAQGKLLTVVRLDGQGNGNPFVIDMRQVVI